MRLAPFIQTHMEAILVDWETFARSLYPPYTAMTPRMLRDHAQQILEAVAKDLATPQTGREQSEKSLGHAPVIWNAPETAAETHAVLRAQSGIDINQLAAEYRALRASVVRLWEEECLPGPEGLQDMIRFNEAIDQALAESIRFFSAQLERSRNLLLGMLGHDMRNPLNAIMMTASSLRELSLGEEEVAEAGQRLTQCGSSMKALLDDLLDFNRTTLGIGINLAIREVDVGSLFTDEIKQHLVANPARQITLTVEGEVRGYWDGHRLQQALRNLVSNACTYGAEGEPVRVALRGNAAGLRFEVANGGPAIDPAKAEQLFDPLRRGDLDSSRVYKEGLGLGLYIVREIARAHGGDVELRSDETETVFSVHLPRTAGQTTQA